MMMIIICLIIIIIVHLKHPPFVLPFTFFQVLLMLTIKKSLFEKLNMVSVFTL